MTYKAFQDYYKEQSIKNLLVHEHNGVLVSPPFGTENCRDWSTVRCFDGNNEWSINLDLPPATSKFNSMISMGDSVWFIPYGIWDDFNVVVQLKNFKPIYHYIDKKGKGQFYSAATNGKTAFSFPLGYEETSYGLFIKDDTVRTVDFNKQQHTKLHMGTVYCNGKYWSAPRSDEPGYVNFVSFNGEHLETYPLELKNPAVTRKYTDIIVYNNKLFSLPFGETSGLKEVIEFDTETNNCVLHELDIPDFAKKYNVSVLIDDVVIALPYGDEHADDSNWGLVFNLTTKEHKVFDIGLSFGGKYRFRSGINYKDLAVFLPTGTPSCPILVIDKHGNIVFKRYCTDYMLGRPVIFKNSLYTMSYNFKTKESQFLSLDSFLR